MGGVAATGVSASESLFDSSSAFISLLIHLLGKHAVWKYSTLQFFIYIDFSLIDPTFCFHLFFYCFANKEGNIFIELTSPQATVTILDSEWAITHDCSRMS